MKFKNLIIPFIFAVLTTLLIKQFFMRDQDQVTTNITQKDGRFLAPDQEEVQRPLNFEIDFIDRDKKRIEKAKINMVETPLARYSFSTDGASLERLEFKHQVDGKKEILPALFPPTAEEREQRCFLVGLSEKTPFYYQFVNQKETDENIQLEYRATTDQVIVTKQFIISKKNYLIDLNLSIKPLGKVEADNPLYARILYPSPMFPPIEQEDEITVIINKGSSQLERKKYQDETWPRAYWFKPQIFGADDRYFVYALSNDQNNFVQRAFCKAENPHSFISFLESTPIEKEQNWQISFYFGPKQYQPLVAANPILEHTLDYGWLSWIAKGLMFFLSAVNKYTHSWGIAIILLTILIQILLWPFNPYDEKKTKMRNEMQSKLQYVKQRYKDDKEMLAKKQQEILQKYGTGDIAGCLVLVLQLPVFFALRMILVNSIDLYHAPFLWISNLAGKDPYYILPTLTGLVMLARAATVDAKQRLFVMIFSVVAIAFFVNFSAGLCLYFFMSTVFGLLQPKIQKLWAK